MRKSKILVLSIVLLLGVGLLAGCTGDDGGQAGEQPKDKAEKLVVGVDTSFVPFEFRNEETGNYEGFDIDMWAEIAKRLEVDYELSPMDFNALIPSLQTDKIDAAIAGMTIKPERREKVDFSMPYYDSGLLIMVRADNSDIQGKEDLKGKVVGTKTGATSYDFVASIDGVKKNTPFPNITDAYMALRNGNVDAAVHDAPNVKYYIKTAGDGEVKTVGKLMEGQSYGIAFPKGSELTAQVDEALQAMKDDGTYNDIYEKWFGKQPEK
ncbi:glutamine ABC transporter substrate-binding protein GlnH [Metallumcola ferriviriculae]|uniref:Glutamine ABC transporter substrate-binding protein GlnH n=1 Tax=Metallumcola ferriviriculae TaxID=3039180 RepID=A0AAU0UPI9_9FIRM|nr:glutamine ABC transporter substrate-binding protein GlnH [Desulfitibacteraceae bacterium MK1]